LVVVGGLLGFATVSVFFAFRFTSPPRRELSTPPERFLAEHEVVRFAATDGVVLEGWLVPCPNTHKAAVLLHGNGSNRTQCLARARLLRNYGYAVLLYDARGHGRSGDALVTIGRNETRDLLGALAWLRSRGFTEIGCLGISQGGATIALAAAELGEVRWVVLESVFPALTDAIDRRFRRTVSLPGWLAGSIMVPVAEWRTGMHVSAIAPRDTIAELRCPVFVMSGELDTHTLISGAREVYDRALAPKTWWAVPGAAHNDLYGVAKEEYERRLSSFLAAANPGATQSR
jgi:pimeloyl-ACP methyl ester carboxylesterase